MSIILSIDTSSTDLGIGIYKDGQAAVSMSRFIPNSHAEHIAQGVKMVLQLNKITAEEITHVGITTGPGSFTGLRIGISFVKGFCLGSKKPVAPFSSLFVLANTFKAKKGTKIFSAIDARRDEIFWASFLSNGDGTVTRLSPDTISHIDSMLVAASDPQDIIITDTMGYSRSTIFKILESNPNHFPVETYPVHRGLSVSQAAYNIIDEEDSWVSASVLEPEYLRLSSAQIKAAG
ncbi:TsaB protein, required for threonylcarbamoyladenosine (t(6)A) formation in tRNA [Chitinispirillum alkaliphilum]|nr:TsaB protein, required for threonylcarbamoyladenosine (t(6)A) formation in tRNA [Chitinispirillum alkaliphilum]